MSVFINKVGLRIFSILEPAAAPICFGKYYPPTRWTSSLSVEINNKESNDLVSRSQNIVVSIFDRRKKETKAECLSADHFSWNDLSFSSAKRASFTSSELNFPVWYELDA